MTAPLYLCLHLRDFAAQAIVCAQPELHARSLAVLSGEPPLEHVFAMTRRARRLGVEEGMSRVQAESFSVTVARRDRRREALGFQQLMQCAQQLSPRVQAIAAPREERCGATLMLDVSGSQRLLGGAAEIGSALWRSVFSLGYEASVASAHKASAALLTARGTDGVTTIAPGREAEVLAPLPLSVLEPDVVAAQTFESWGIHTLRQLAALPAKPLAARLGQSGLQMQRLARGECNALLVPAEEPADAPLTESMELDDPVELLEPLLFRISQMLGRLLLRAGEQALAIAAVETTLLLERSPQVERSIRDIAARQAPACEHRRLVRPTLPEWERPILLKLVQLDLEQHPPEAAVIALRVTAYPAPPQRAQHGLFAAQAPESGRMEVLLARLRKLVGEGRVGAAELLDSHAPEAFRVSDFEFGQSSQPFTAGAAPAALALRMVRPPQAVAMELRDGAPAAMEYEGRRLTLQAASGPWRSDGAWWTHRAWCREEWDVTARERPPRCLRLAHDPAADCWYVIGIYD